MNTWSRCFGCIGALLAAIAVALAAWHAHGLRTQLDEAAYLAFGRGLQQQMFAALALLGAALWERAAPSLWIRLAGLGLALGALLFCGDVYLGALSGEALGVAPMGGTTLILAWLLFAVAALRSR